MTDGPCFAVPFQPYPAKLEQILDRVCDHRPWFPDALWENPVVRRQAASQRLAEWLVDGVVWEAYRGDQLVGILGIDRVVPQHEAYCHFIFFDRKLNDKVDLCLSLMGWCFKALDLHILRIEIPTYARVLARFARKKLQFRYEAEHRQLSWPPGPGLDAKQAELGSRKYHGQHYEGRWHDLLLLSLTREEYNGWSQSNASPSQFGSHGAVAVPHPELPASGSAGPTSNGRAVESVAAAVAPPTAVE